MRHFVINDSDMRPLITRMHVKCVLFLKSHIFKVNTSAIVFTPESLDPDRKVRPGLELIKVK